nr:unnamed protein product [Digitaria exilis]
MISPAPRFLRVRTVPPAPVRHTTSTGSPTVTAEAAPPPHPAPTYIRPTLSAHTTPLYRFPFQPPRERRGGNQVRFPATPEPRPRPFFPDGPALRLINHGGLVPLVRLAAHFFFPVPFRANFWNLLVGFAPFRFGDECALDVSVVVAGNAMWTGRVR